MTRHLSPCRVLYSILGLLMLGAIFGGHRDALHKTGDTPATPVAKR